MLFLVILLPTRLKMAIQSQNQRIVGLCADTDFCNHTYRLTSHICLYFLLTYLYAYALGLAWAIGGLARFSESVCPS
jgi:hypothetical protein